MCENQPGVHALASTRTRASFLADTRTHNLFHTGAHNTHAWTELEAYLLLDVAQLRGGWEDEIRNWTGGRVDGRQTLVLELEESKRHEILGEQREGPRY